MLEVRKEYFADERDDNLKEIGKGTQRQDMLGHVTGASTYFNDHKLQGLLHLKVFRSEQPHARLRRIDLTEADRGNIQLLDTQSGVLKIAVHRGFESPFLTFFASVSSDDAAACGAAIRCAQRIVVEDAGTGEDITGDILDLLIPPTRRDVAWALRSPPN